MQMHGFLLNCGMKRALPSVGSKSKGRQEKLHMKERTVETLNERISVTVNLLGGGGDNTGSACFILPHLNIS